MRWLNSYTLQEIPAKNKERGAPFVEEFEGPVINADRVDFKEVLGDVCPRGE